MVVLYKKSVYTEGSVIIRRVGLTGCGFKDLFKHYPTGEIYYRYDEHSRRIDYGYPRYITDAWVGVPRNFDSVCIWRNRVTYFFKGGVLVKLY